MSRPKVSVTVEKVDEGLDKKLENLKQRVRFLEGQRATQKPESVEAGLLKQPDALPSSFLDKYQRQQTKSSNKIFAIQFILAFSLGALIMFLVTELL